MHRGVSAQTWDSHCKMIPTNAVVVASCISYVQFGLTETCEFIWLIADAAAASGAVREHDLIFFIKSKQK